METAAVRVLVAFVAEFNKIDYHNCAEHHQSMRVGTATRGRSSRRHRTLQPYANVALREGIAIAALALCVAVCISPVLLAVRLPAATMPFHSANAQPGSGHVKDDASAHFLRARLVIVQDLQSLQTLENLCSIMPHVACDHVYRMAIKGVAGRFSDRHVQHVRSCLGEKLLFVEEDGKVVKAEGPHEAFGQPVAGAEEQRWVSMGHVDGEADSIPAGRRAWLYKSLGREAAQLVSKGLSVFSDNRPFTGQNNGTGAAAVGSLATHREQDVKRSRQVCAAAEPATHRDQQSRLLGSICDPEHQSIRSGSAGLGDAAPVGKAAAASQLTQATLQLQSAPSSPDTDIHSYTSPPANVGIPHSPEVPALPTNPPELPGAAPGPSAPLSQVALSQLAAAENKPVEKLQHLPRALWGLDRIDQRSPPLDRSYSYGSPDTAGAGAGVIIYTLDSGVHLSHQEFKGWGAGQESRASYGYDFVDGDAIAEDCDGHGTHVAATAIGRSVGAAKSARVVAVRILDCAGSGTISDTVAGLDWIARNAQRPAIVIMSLGVPEGSWSRSLEQATMSVIRDHEISIIVASGNAAVDACAISPARLPAAITVAGSNLENKFSATDPSGIETMYKWPWTCPETENRSGIHANLRAKYDACDRSNTGACVDIFAPGVEIWSACGGKGRCPVVTDDAYTWASGTSMAVPHVAGAAAIYLSQHRDASPAEVASALVNSATCGVINDTRMRPGTTNRLLYTRGVLGQVPGPQMLMADAYRRHKTAGKNRSCPVGVLIRSARL